MPDWAQVPPTDGDVTTLVSFGSPERSPSETSETNVLEAVTTRANPTEVPMPVDSVVEESASLSDPSVSDWHLSPIASDSGSGQQDTVVRRESRAPAESQLDPGKSASEAEDDAHAAGVESELLVPSDLSAATDSAQANLVAEPLTQTAVNGSGARAHTFRLSKFCSPGDETFLVGTRSL